MVNNDTVWSTVEYHGKSYLPDMSQHTHHDRYWCCFGGTFFIRVTGTNTKSTAVVAANNLCILGKFTALDIRGIS